MGKSEAEIFSQPERVRCIVLSRDVVLQPSKAGAPHEPLVLHKGQSVNTVLEACLGTMTPHHFVTGPAGIGLQIPIDAIP